MQREESNNTSCGYLQEQTLTLDKYARPFAFLLPDHAPKYRTYLGSFFTICTLIGLVFYGGYKLSVLAAYEQYNVETAIKENYYPLLESLSTTNGFKVAAAVTSYDGSSDVIEDPDYGVTRFFIKSFGYGETGVQFKELKTELCGGTTALGGEGTGFYTANPVSYNDRLVYGPKMKCITDQYEILGNYNTDTAKNLMVVFDRCDRSKRSTCHSDAEISAWMKGKYLITLENESKFISHKFREEKISRLSNLKYYPLSVETRVDSVQVVQRTEAALNDALFTIGGLGAEVFEGFFIENKTARSIVYENLFQTSVTFELTQTQTEYIRKVYSVLDFASDLGGLSGAFAPIFVLMISLFQKAGAHTILLAHLSEKKEKDTGHDNSDKPSKDEDLGTLRQIQWRCCTLTHFNLKRLCPRLLRCFCIKQSRRDRLFSTKFASLSKELHVGYLIKHIRIFKALFKERMTEQEWRTASRSYSTKSSAKTKHLVPEVVIEREPAKIREYEFEDMGPGQQRANQFARHDRSVSDSQFDITSQIADVTQVNDPSHMSAYDIVLESNRPAEVRQERNGFDLDF